MGLLSNIFRNMGGHHGGGHGNKHSGGHGNRGYRDERYDNYPPPAGQGPAVGAVVCSACSTANIPGARFCAQCGKAMAPGVCSGCNASLVAGAKFCASCGKAQG